MGELFSALGQSLQGLERGLLLKRELKREAVDDAIRAEDRKLMMQDRAMQQREFELSMKRAGLALEQAEFEFERDLAMGTPQEQAKAALAERQMQIQRDVEEHALKIQKLQSEIAENEAQAGYYRQGGAGGFRTEKDTTFADAMKVIDGQIKQLESVLDDAVTSNDQERANAVRAQITQLMNQREILANSSLAELGLPMDQFGLGGGGAAPEESEAPEAPKENNLPPLIDDPNLGRQLGRIFQVPLIKALGERSANFEQNLLTAGQYSPALRQFKDASGNVVMLDPGAEATRKMIEQGLVSQISQTQPSIMDFLIPKRRVTPQQSAQPALPVNPLTVLFGRPGMQ